MAGWTLRICGVMMTLVLFFSAWNGAQENRDYRVRGQRAVLEAPQSYTQTTETSTKAGIKTGESTRYSAQVSFTTKSEQRITVNRDLAPATLSALMRGEPVFVEYLPDAPRQARLAGARSATWEMLLGGLVVMLLTGFFWRKMGAMN